jgi:hypothetical protein
LGELGAGESVADVGLTSGSVFAEVFIILVASIELIVILFFFGDIFLLVFLGLIVNGFSLLSQHHCIKVFIFFDITDYSLISSPVGLFISSEFVFVSLSLSPIFFDQLLDLVLAQRSSSFSEELNNCAPIGLLLLQFSLHTIKDFLEGFSLDTRAALGISSNSRVNGSNLGVFTNGQEEGKCIDSIFPSSGSWNTVKDIFQKL